MKKFGLIGKQLSHSFSKSFFHKKFNEENIDATYENYELSDLKDLRFLIEKNRLCGMNVTIPYKEEVINYIDELDDTCTNIGAVNTLVPQYSGNRLVSIKGYNTDTYGFSQSIKPYLRSYHENVLILGTGGASKAVSHVLKQLNLKVNYITRKSTVDSKDFFGWNELNENMVKYHKFIINTTPIGMFPNHDQEFSFPYQAITNKHFVMDLIYNPEETNFLKKAKKMGANTINGYSMLVFQALKSWDIWNS